MHETNPKDAIGATKLQLGLIPFSFAGETALAMTDGKYKYGAHNFVFGARASVYIDAALRHIWRYESGQDVDPESGVSNLAHAAACMAILFEAQSNGVLNDDRPPPMDQELLARLQDDFNRRSSEIISRHAEAGRAPRHYRHEDSRPPSAGVMP